MKLTCKCPHEHPHREARGICVYCVSDGVKAVKALKKLETDIAALRTENRELAASVAVLKRGLSDLLAEIEGESYE